MPILILARLCERRQGEKKGATPYVQNHKEEVESKKQGEDLFKGPEQKKMTGVFDLRNCSIAFEDFWSCFGLLFFSFLA